MSTPPIPPGGDAPQPPQRTKSTRRSLVANLPTKLSDEVTASVELRSSTTISNVKKIMKAVVTIEAGGSPDAPTEENKQLALFINQSLKENQARRKKLQGNRGAASPGPSRLTQQGKKNSVRGAVAEVTDSDDREFALKFGTRRGAMSITQGEVQAIDPGLKMGEQTLQLLGHLAQLYMNLAKDMEYQILLVNNRLLVASNKPAAIETFSGANLQKMLAAAAGTRALPTDDGKSAAVRTYLAGALAEALRRPKDSQDPVTVAQQDGAAMLAEYETGFHLDHAARPLLKSLVTIVQYQAMNNAQMHGPVTPDKAAALIDNPKFEHAVICVKPPTETGWHAEQALVSALVHAGWRRGAVVGGTKLPCFSCWFTLSLVNQCGFPLMFIPTPGLLWETTTLPGITKVAKQLKIGDVVDLASQFRTALSLTDNEFGQFMTALKRQEDSFVDTGLSGKEMRAQGLTQNQSQKSFYFGQYAPTPKDLPGDEPGSPVGDYGTPPSSPGGQADYAMELAYQEEHEDYERKLADYQKGQQKDKSSS